MMKKLCAAQFIRTARRRVAKRRRTMARLRAQLDRFGKDPSPANVERAYTVAMEDY